MRSNNKRSYISRRTRNIFIICVIVTVCLFLINTLGMKTSLDKTNESETLKDSTHHHHHSNEDEKPSSSFKPITNLPEDIIRERKDEGVDLKRNDKKDDDTGPIIDIRNKWNSKYTQDSHKQIERDNKKEQDTIFREEELGEDNGDVDEDNDQNSHNEGDNNNNIENNNNNVFRWNGIEYDDENLEVPRYLSYGQYTKERMYEPELRKRVDPRILNSCKFCSYPFYDRIFKYSGSKYSWADAFINEGGKHVIILSDKPGGRSLVLSNPHIELYFASGRKTETLQCHTHSGNGKTLKITCPITDKSFLDDCFHIQLFNKDNKKILKNRLLARHCFTDENYEKQDMAICSMIENRDRFLVEWIEYHLMLGVNHFFLYFHPGGYRFYDYTFALLEEYMKDGVVDVFIWNYTVPIWSRSNNYNSDQVAAQTDCLYRFRDYYKWIGYTDDDEFIVPVKDDSIIDVLRRYETNDVGGVQMNSWLYGNGRTTDTTLSLSAYYPYEKKEWRFRKMIVQPQNVQYFDIHDIASGKRTARMKETDDGMYLAHYYYRKWHDFNPIIERDANFQVTPVARFVEPVKERVERYEERVNVERFKFDYHTKLRPGIDKPK